MATYTSSTFIGFLRCSCLSFLNRFGPFKCHFFLSLLALFLACKGLEAQEKTPPPLRVTGLYPSGLRNTVTDSWGTLSFSVANLSDKDRGARVVVFFQGHSDIQYGKDVWVPANSVVSTWMRIGPPPEDKTQLSRTLEYLVFDKLDGKETLLLPREDGKIRSRPILYRKREAFSAIYLDKYPPYPRREGNLPEPELPMDEAVKLVRTARLSMELSELVHAMNDGDLPPTPDAYAGIDHFVLASDRIRQDPVGLQALRQWLEQGGKVWVMLDMVSPELAASLVGDGLNFQVVDKVGLNKFRIDLRQSNGIAKKGVLQDHERPIAFARVLLPAEEQVKYSINGWPVWFTRQMGKGSVVFTTLGARGWYRNRGEKDPPSPFEHFPNTPLPTDTLREFVSEIETSNAAKEEPMKVEVFQEPLSEEIGYTVLSRQYVLGVCFVFLVGAIILGLLLRKIYQRELLGWLGPIAALGAAVVLTSLGIWSRQAASPTQAISQIVHAVPGMQEIPLRGLVAIYEPDSGPVEFRVEKGGIFELDMSGMGGQTRRLITTDVDAWHWENLAFPAGVRFATFKTTLPTKEPIRAIGHLGPKGLTGKIASGPFQDLEDMLIHPSHGRNLAVKHQEDGTFQVGEGDTLPLNQFLTSAIFTDQQQRREKILREFLKKKNIWQDSDQVVMMAWSKPLDLGIKVNPIEKHVGSALLVIPLQLEPTPPGSKVLIPGPLVPYRRILDNLVIAPTFEYRGKAEMHLRFQLPKEVLPLKVEEVRLRARVTAPSRRVTFSGMDGKNLVDLLKVESPLDPINLKISDPKFLQVDEKGGLHFQLSFTGILDGNQNDQVDFQRNQPWQIEYLELEVLGQNVANK